MSAFMQWAATATQHHDARSASQQFTYHAKASDQAAPLQALVYSLFGGDGMPACAVSCSARHTFMYMQS